jgi:hypothetical protein
MAANGVWKDNSMSKYKSATGDIPYDHFEDDIGYKKPIVSPESQAAADQHVKEVRAAADKIIAERLKRHRKTFPA